MNNEALFRKPVSFPQYYILLIKHRGEWQSDSGSWNESDIRRFEAIERRTNPTVKTKVITSPSDDFDVIRAILSQMNRY